jgi:hypothetical protein
MLDFHQIIKILQWIKNDHANKFYINNLKTTLIYQKSQNLMTATESTFKKFIYCLLYSVFSNIKSMACLTSINDD